MTDRNSTKPVTDPIYVPTMQNMTGGGIVYPTANNQVPKENGTAGEERQTGHQEGGQGMGHMRFNILDVDADYLWEYLLETNGFGDCLTEEQKSHMGEVGQFLGPSFGTIYRSDFLAEMQNIFSAHPKPAEEPQNEGAGNQGIMPGEWDHHVDNPANKRAGRRNLEEKYPELKPFEGDMVYLEKTPDLLRGSEGDIIEFYNHENESGMVPEGEETEQERKPVSEKFDRDECEVQSQVQKLLYTEQVNCKDFLTDNISTLPRKANLNPDHCYRFNVEGEGNEMRIDSVQGIACPKDILRLENQKKMREQRDDIKETLAFLEEVNSNLAAGYPQNPRKVEHEEPEKVTMCNFPFSLSNTLSGTIRVPEKSIAAPEIWNAAGNAVLANEYATCFKAVAQKDRKMRQEKAMQKFEEIEKKVEQKRLYWEEEEEIPMPTDPWPMDGAENPLAEGEPMGEGKPKDIEPKDGEIPMPTEPLPMDGEEFNPLDGEQFNPIKGDEKPLEGEVINNLSGEETEEVEEDLMVGDINCTSHFKTLLGNAVEMHEAKELQHQQYLAAVKEWYHSVSTAFPEEIELPEWVDKANFGLDFSFSNEIDQDFPGSEMQEYEMIAQFEELDNHDINDLAALSVEEDMVAEEDFQINFDFSAGSF